MPCAFMRGSCEALLVSTRTMFRLPGCLRDQLTAFNKIALVVGILFQSGKRVQIAHCCFLVMDEQIVLSLHSTPHKSCFVSYTTPAHACEWFAKTIATIGRDVPRIISYPRFCLLLSVVAFGSSGEVTANATSAYTAFPEVCAPVRDG